MKRNQLVISLLLISLSAFATEKIVQVKTAKSSAQKPRPRSEEIMPTIYVDIDACQLTICMVSDDSYTINVYDSSGSVIYQGAVVSDGGRHVYMLPELEADLYMIAIESCSARYEGEFYSS